MIYVLFGLVGFLYLASWIVARSWLRDSDRLTSRIGKLEMALANLPREVREQVRKELQRVSDG
jgi:hypothetical protein